MRVSELMKSEVITCKDDARLGEVARLMWERDVGFVPVVSNRDGGLVGVITDRDALIGAYFHGTALWEIPVAEVMSRGIATCGPDADVSEAERLMREFQVHRLPVVARDGKLLGIVSLNDLAREATKYGDERLEEEVALTLGAICQPRLTGSQTLVS